MTNVVSLDLPTALGPRIQNALKADPTTVDLRSLASHFYSLGERILSLLEEDELVDILTEVQPPGLDIYRRIELTGMIDV
jgi:GINS complex subunit 3